MEKGEKIFLTGIGGRILGYVHTLSLTMGKKNFPCKIVFSPEFHVSFNLLGRDNFFLPFILMLNEFAITPDNPKFRWAHRLVLQTHSASGYYQFL